MAEGVKFYSGEENLGSGNGPGSTSPVQPSGSPDSNVKMADTQDGSGKTAFTPSTNMQHQGYASKVMPPTGGVPQFKSPAKDD